MPTRYVETASELKENNLNVTWTLVASSVPTAGTPRYSYWFSDARKASTDNV